MDISEEDIASLRKSGEFDAVWYLKEYPDVAMTGIDPERHYLWIGRRLGRRPSPVSRAQPLSAAAPATPEHPTKQPTPETQRANTTSLATRLVEKAKSSFRRRDTGIDPGVVETVEQHFDVDYYLTTYPDIAAADVDPVVHYLQTGWHEGRDPSLAFSTKYYIDNNPDVVAAGVNPFYHFLVAGKAEGRVGRHTLGFRWDILSRLKTVADQIAEYKAHRPHVDVDPRIKLQRILEQSLVMFGKKILLSFSHDNYTRHVGGVQLLLRRELKLLQDRGYLQVHFYPVHPLPFLDTSGDAIQLGVLLNGELAGVFHPQDIIACLAGIDARSLHSKFVIHNLLGHNIDQVIAIIRACGASEGSFWIHDFAALYNNFKLLRNDVEYSGVPQPGSLAWQLCEFAQANFSHRDEFAKLFNAFSIDLLSPSASALTIWQEAGVHTTRSSRVISHATLQSAGLRQAPFINEARPLRVGFIGFPADHKGWSVFQELVLRLADDPRYEFHHLGKGRRGGLPVQYREVVACEDEPDLMRTAIAAVELDVALMWSIWPETFCLTAYEAVAGGAAIVTNKNAGNVVDLVETRGPGAVFRNEAELIAAFETGAVIEFSRARRAVQHYQLEYSAMTLELLDGVA